MKELNREDCERIYGCGINIAPALRGLGEFGEDFAHGAEGGIQLADALGLFEPPEKSTPKYTSDPQLLNMDVNIANTYMHEIQTHTGSDQITDTMREDAIHNLQMMGGFILILYQIILSLWAVRQVKGHFLQMKLKILM